MKQIEIIKTYAQKRCLIVDDVPDIRTSLKRLLVDFGSQDIDTAGNAEEAIDLCQKKPYDIVLADYNLGPGKNGQQLLEELRFHKLLRQTSIYIMIASEASSQEVLLTLEYQPDDYVSKPINREGLRPRLDAALLKNESLSAVKKALEKQKPKQAIAACQALLENGNPRYANDTKKILGELLYQQNKFAEALQIYRDFPEDRQPLWAKLGEAKAYFGSKQFNEAATQLQQIIADTPMCVDAHDLLAEIYQAQNEFEQAQHALSTAVKISPGSVKRQRELGKISVSTGDNTAAISAFRSAVKQSKNSCQERPEDYLNLSQQLAELAKTHPSTIEPSVLSEANDCLKQVEKKYGTNPLVQLKSALIEATLHKSQDRLEKMQAALDSALDTYHGMKMGALKNMSVELCIDCAKGLMDCGFYDEGEKLLQALIKNQPDTSYSLSIDKLLREPVTKEGIQYAAELNRQGIDCYQNNDYFQAVKAFKDVLREIPNHIGLNLNLIQALVSKHKAKPLSEAECALIENCLLRVGDIGESSKHYKRFSYLEKRYKKISHTAMGVANS